MNEEVQPIDFDSKTEQGRRTIRGQVAFCKYDLFLRNFRGRSTLDKMSFFPDILHIKRINTALWRGREYGQASVMVGAGFSLNARSVSPFMRGLPTWSQLADQLVEELHPPDSLSSDERQRLKATAMSTSGALRLAEEYEAAFGRDALDAFLLTAMPDMAYEPSPLHELLLTLPWADVLTTNYDTLLERGAQRVIDRRYQTIMTPADIPGSHRPRIIKLHGSFPATRPFIFTEEDFRTYPRRFAPFVNLAQEVAMETVLCLIGFSGADPNFLYWTGWVRDNLGPSSPQIYLCGLLDLNTAQRSLLHDRNVVPIDLSPIFPREKIPDPATRHYKAIEWLLLNFESGRTFDQLWWPEQVTPPRTTPSLDLPPLLGVPETKTSDPFPSGTEQASAELALSLTCQWKAVRSQYPGWIIAPRSNRERLWDGTSSWLPIVMRMVTELLPTQSISLLYELNWRFERCLFPMFTDLERHLVTALESVNPFPGQLDLPNAGVVMGASGDQSADWAKTRAAWIDLAFAVLRSAREDGDDAKYSLWGSRLEKLATLDDSVGARLAYDRCLMALGQLDHARAREIVGNWRNNERDPFQYIRRASIYAELGDVQSAIELAERGLTETRSAMRQQTSDIGMLSREGWAMLMVNVLQFARAAFDLHQQHGEFRYRWERLAEYRCNPHTEWDLLEEEMKRTFHPRPSESESVNFDGSVHRSRHFSMQGIDKDVIAAMQAIRLIDESGYPPKCGFVICSGNVLKDAAKRLSSGSPSLAASCFFRSADAEAIRGFYDHQRVALMGADDIVRLREIASKALSNSVGSTNADLGKHGLDIAAVDRAKAALAILAVTAARLSPDKLVDELKRAVCLYQNATIASSLSLYEWLERYIDAVLDCLPDDALRTVALDLVTLPMPGWNDFHVAVTERWPEPLRFQRALPPDVRDHSPSRWRAAIADLIEAAASDQSDVRRRAVSRLSLLHHSRILQGPEQSAFAAALWSKVGDSGLPSMTDLMDFAFLWLPEPSPGAAVERFKAHYLGSDVPPIVTTIRQPDGREVRQTAMGLSKGIEFNTIRGATDLRGEDHSGPGRIRWTTDEARRIIEIAMRWWNSEGHSLCLRETPPPHMFVGDSVRERVESMISLISTAIPYLSAPPDGLQEQIDSLIRETEAVGFATEQAAVSQLKLHPAHADTVATRIRQALVAPRRAQVRSGINALHLWLLGAKTFAFPTVPTDLIHELGNIIAARRQPALHAVIGFCRVLIKDFPEMADKGFFDSVSLGLEYLLEETKYRSDPTQWPTNIPAPEVAAYRRLAAKLAATMSTSLKVFHPVIDKWRRALSVDPLAPLQQVFNGRDDED
jgi:tetratricopeptide (TPR) repeat protein